jgi:broad specificity phosphatase PhoE
LADVYWLAVRPVTTHDRDMTLFYLVQHGEKAPVAGDPGLTQRGRRQARLAGAHLSRVGLSAVYSSPLRLARETAGIVASAVGLDVQMDDRVRERTNWNGPEPVEPWQRTPA